MSPFFSFISFIVSSNLKQQILSHLKIVKKYSNKEKKLVVESKPIELMKMSISTGDELMSLLNDSENTGVCYNAKSVEISSIF